MRHLDILPPPKGGGFLQRSLQTHRLNKLPRRVPASPRQRVFGPLAGFVRLTWPPGATRPTRAAGRQGHAGRPGPPGPRATRATRATRGMLAALAMYPACFDLAARGHPGHQGRGPPGACWPPWPCTQRVLTKCATSPVQVS